MQAFAGVSADHLPARLILCFDPWSLTDAQATFRSRELNGLSLDRLHCNEEMKSRHSCCFVLLSSRKWRNVKSNPNFCFMRCAKDHDQTVVFRPKAHSGSTSPNFQHGRLLEKCLLLLLQLWGSTILLLDSTMIEALLILQKGFLQKGFVVCKNDKTFGQPKPFYWANVQTNCELQQILGATPTYARCWSPQEL